MFTLALLSGGRRKTTCRPNLPVHFIGANVDLINALWLPKLGPHLSHHGGQTVGAFAHHHGHFVAPADAELVLPGLILLVVVVRPAARQRSCTLVQPWSKNIHWIYISGNSFSFILESLFFFRWGNEQAGIKAPTRLHVFTLSPCSCGQGWGWTWVWYPVWTEKQFGPLKGWGFWSSSAKGSGKKVQSPVGHCLEQIAGCYGRVVSECLAPEALLQSAPASGGGAARA